MVVEGLNVKTPEETMMMLKELKFNSIRIPLSLKFALSDFTKVSHNIDNVSEDYTEIVTWQVLDSIVSAASKEGILVTLDMHTIDPESEDAQELWYCDNEETCRYSEKDFFKGWERVLKRYSS